MVGETSAAVTPIVVCDLYSFGRYFISSQPAATERTSGVIQYHLRRVMTER